MSSSRGAQAERAPLAATAHWPARHETVPRDCTGEYRFGLRCGGIFKFSLRGGRAGEAGGEGETHGAYCTPRTTSRVILPSPAEIPECRYRFALDVPNNTKSSTRSLVLFHCHSLPLSLSFVQFFSVSPDRTQRRNAQAIGVFVFRDLSMVQEELRRNNFYPSFILRSINF